MRFIWAILALSLMCLGCSSNDACANAGGTCMSASSCDPSSGHLNPATCSGSGDLVCCMQLSACPVPEPICCGSQGETRPDCVSNAYTCPSGQALCGDGGS